MGLVVLKFGGTSVATAEKFVAAAKRAIRAKLAGHQVVVVVSARGQTTDELIDLAEEITPNPPARELDMLMATGEQVSLALLAMAIHSLGHEAVSLTGGQMGIVTDSLHGMARIQGIETTRIRNHLNDGKIAIVAGFQGMDENQNFTTLGRGGSDTTAVAIAAALGADVCEIYTDVNGVYTTDPRVVPEARKMDQISYDEMLELASVGAGVMHSRSIEFAKKYGVVVHVRNSGSDATGTVIRPESADMEKIVVRGCARAKDEARVTVRSIPDAPGTLSRIFNRIADEHIVMDMIVLSPTAEGKIELSFGVAEKELRRTLECIRALAQELGAGPVDTSVDIAKVSVVGLGMRTHTGVAERMFKVLADGAIDVQVITTSEIKISVLVDQSQALRALAAVHQEFSLDQPTAEKVEDPRYRPRGEMTGSHVSEDQLRSIAKNLPAMEDILVSDVEIDERQARVTLYEVPDQTGVAAKIFSRVAEANVTVDMIVQSAGAGGRTNLSFTVLRTDLPGAIKAVQQVLGEVGGGRVVADERIAKLSLRGVGVRTHTGVAAKAFKVLAEKNVSLQLVNTSELHLTTVVAERDAKVALDSLRAAFKLAGS